MLIKKTRLLFPLGKIETSPARGTTLILNGELLPDLLSLITLRQRNELIDSPILSRKCVSESAAE